MASSTFGYRRSASLVVALTLAVLLVVTTLPALEVRSRTPVFSEACDDENPYLVTTCFRRSASWAIAARDPAIVAFRDTPGDTPHHLLATYKDVGAVYGLAYNARESAVYAAAFHKRQMLHGPGGPGAIYRIDVNTGDVDHAITVPNPGDDEHHSRYGDRDLQAEKHAGKTSLGDIDVDPSGTELAVANLNDRRIYRFSIPDGQLLGSFDNGAVGEPWAADARPFGLTYHDGLLYHAVVNSAESTNSAADLSAHVYSSAPDGSGMREVASTPLDYARGVIRARVTGWRDTPVNWEPWSDSPTNRLPKNTDALTQFRISPIPIASDIVFDADNGLALGLRDRITDMSPVGTDSNPTSRQAFGISSGDLLLGVPEIDTWQFDLAPEHFGDDTADTDEATLGGLAFVNQRGAVVSNGWGDLESRSLSTIEGKEWPSAFWFDGTGGGKLGIEGVCRTYGAQPRLVIDLVPEAEAHCPGVAYAGSIGDLEVLCGEDVAPPPSPSPSPTHTSAPPTTTSTPSPRSSPAATIEPTVTATPTASSTPTNKPVPLYLPLLLREHCRDEHKRADIALVVDTSGSMKGDKIEAARQAALSFVAMVDLAPGRAQLTVIRYDREAEVVQPLTRARAVVESAIRSLHVRSGTHIDKGLRTALAELQSVRHIQRNLPVIVLLTDGVQTGTPGAELAAAEEAHNDGIRIYAIGLGADVDEVTLRTIAGSDERYYFAPDAASLAVIYADVASDIMCPGMWGGR